LIRPLHPNAYGYTVTDHSLVESFNFRQFTNGVKVQAWGPVLQGDSGAWLNIPGYNFDHLYNEALEKLTSKLRGDLDLSIDLAEAHKTAKMLHIKDQVIDYTKTFVRRFGPIKAASNAWLAYTYGVKPLVQSLFGVAEENLRVVINNTARLRVRANDVTGVDWVETDTCLGGNIRWLKPKGTVKYSVTLGVDVRTDQFDISRWSSLNPVSIAWELLPFSFVFDWFLNVGGYLRNMETYLLNANKFRSGYRTNFVRADLRWEDTSYSGTDATSTWRSIYNGTGKFTILDRTVLSSYPAPTLPSLRADLGSSRLLSGAALLGQLLGRR
jgi:hypothetical protein